MKFNSNVAKEYLCKAYPYYNFSSGYISNYSMTCDNNRSFRIWCESVQEVGSLGYEQPIVIRLGSEEDMHNRSVEKWILLLMQAVKHIERAAQKEVNHARTT